MRYPKQLRLIFVGYTPPRPTPWLSSPSRLWRSLRGRAIAGAVRIFCGEWTHVAIEQDGWVATMNANGWRIGEWDAYQRRRILAWVQIPSTRFDTAGMEDATPIPAWPVALRRFTGLTIGYHDCVQTAAQAASLACGYELPRVTTPKELFEWARQLPNTRSWTLSLGEASR